VRGIPLALLAGLWFWGCQGLGWPYGPPPGDVDGTNDPPDCDAPDTCVSKGCGTVCDVGSDCPVGLSCLRFVGVARGFCSRFCDSEAEVDRCGCGWSCTVLDSVSGTPLAYCVERCKHDKDCDLPGWRCTGSWHCVPPDP